MSGYIENSFDENYKHDLYWFEDKTQLHDVKVAIGAKAIWKYRLRFYTNLEEFIASTQKPVNESLTEEELNILEEFHTNANR